MVKTVTLGQHSSRVGHSTRACPQLPLHEVTKIVAFATGCCWSMSGYPQAFPQLSLKFLCLLLEKGKKIKVWPKYLPLYQDHNDLSFYVMC